jgi:hypothetical protein
MAFIANDAINRVDANFIIPTALKNDGADK